MSRAQRYSNDPEWRPWYREPWPWLLIGLTGSAVVASLITLWIALANPQQLVVDEAEYQRLERQLKAAGRDRDSEAGGDD